MKKQGLTFFYYYSNFEFSLNDIIADVGNFILFPFNVILTPFQSISIISHNICLFNLKCSGNKLPVIWNKCMPPTVLKNFTGI